MPFFERLNKDSSCGALDELRHSKQSAPRKQCKKRLNSTKFKPRHACHIILLSTFTITPSPHFYFLTCLTLRLIMEKHISAMVSLFETHVLDDCDSYVAQIEPQVGSFKRLSYTPGARDHLVSVNGLEERDRRP